LLVKDVVLAENGTITVKDLAPVNAPRWACTMAVELREYHSSEQDGLLLIIDQSTRRADGYHSVLQNGDRPENCKLQ
jgi:hypothetical protein